MNFETVRIHFLSGVFVLLSSRNLAVIRDVTTSPLYWRGNSNSRDVVASPPAPSFSFPASPQSCPKAPRRASTLDKIDGKFVPPTLPSNQGWENGAFWLLRGFILDFGGDGGLLFHFYSVQDCWSPCTNRSRDSTVLPRLLIWKTRRPWGRGCGVVTRLAVGGGKFWPPYLNSVLSRQGS